MGCDGGTIPRRDEMVKLKKKAEKAGREAELAAKWRHCALSGEELKKPIVACELGKLYNKESLLLALLDKPSLPEVAQHIRSLRDVVELNLTPNPAYKPVSRAMAEAIQCTEFVCPISGLEMSGRHRFVYFRGCGCVISERTVKEVSSESCYKCGCGYSKADVIILNGLEEEMKKLKESMMERRQEAKQAKMAAKRKRKNAATTSSSVTTGTTSSSSSDQDPSDQPPPTTSSSSSEERDSPPAEKKQKISTKDEVCNPLPGGGGAINNTTTSKLVVSGGNGGKGKVVEKAKKSSLPIGASKYSRQNGKSSSLEGSSSSSPLVGSNVGLGSTASTIVRKTTSELHSFQPANSDPQARDAYKSLFHSAETERPKDKKAHWVTFFPYH